MDPNDDIQVVFQSTPPAREVTQKLLDDSDWLGISIHTSREGGDKQ